jgi:hypothetical protein
MATGCRIDWRLSEVANEEFGLRFFSIGDRHGRSLAYVLGLDRWIAATSEQDAPAACFEGRPGNRSEALTHGAMHARNILRSGFLGHP